MSFKFPLLVKKDTVVCTCAACPSQWEAQTRKGEFVYVRYRYGYLSVVVAPDRNKWYSGEDCRQHFGGQLGDEYDGSMSWPSVIKHAHIMEV